MEGRALATAVASVVVLSQDAFDGKSRFQVEAGRSLKQTLTNL